MPDIALDDPWVAWPRPTVRAQQDPPSWEFVPDRALPVDSGPACATVKNPDIFFPVNPQQAHRAKQICRTCPVWEACLDLNRNEREGVYGGMTAEERRHPVARRRRPAPPPPTPVEQFHREQPKTWEPEPPLAKVIPFPKRPPAPPLLRSPKRRTFGETPSAICPGLLYDDVPCNTRTNHPSGLCAAHRGEA